MAPSGALRATWLERRGCRSRRAVVHDDRLTERAFQTLCNGARSRRWHRRGLAEIDEGDGLGGPVAALREGWRNARGGRRGYGDQCGDGQLAALLVVDCAVFFFTSIS